MHSRVSVLVRTSLFWRVADASRMRQPKPAALLDMNQRHIHVPQHLRLKARRDAYEWGLGRFRSGEGLSVFRAASEHPLNGVKGVQ